MTPCLMPPRLPVQPVFAPRRAHSGAGAYSSMLPRLQARRPCVEPMPGSRPILALRAPHAPRAYAGGDDLPLLAGMGERLQRCAKQVGTPHAGDWAGRMRSALARYQHAEDRLAHAAARQLPDEPARRRDVLGALHVVRNMCDAEACRVPAEMVAALRAEACWEPWLTAVRLRRAELKKPGQFAPPPALQPPRTHCVLVDQLRARLEALRATAQSPVARQWCATVRQRIVDYMEREAAYARDPALLGNSARLSAAAAELSFVLVTPTDRQLQRLIGWEDLKKEAGLMETIAATRCAMDARRLELRPDWTEH